MSHSSLDHRSEFVVSVEDVEPQATESCQDSPTELVEAWMQQLIPNDIDPNKKAVVDTLIARWLEQADA